MSEGAGSAGGSAVRAGGAAAALTAAFWVAICAASPEVIWRGLQASLVHLTAADLEAALIIGLVLAFFVEPFMQRIRGLLDAAHGEVPRARPHAVFTAAISLAFALVSVCLHEAITTFAAGEGDAPGDGVMRAIEVTAGWAVVPFFVTLAWLGATRRRMRVPLALLALASPVLAGWVFAWTWQGVVTTILPCTAIVLVGLWLIPAAPPGREFLRGAEVIAVAAACWFVIGFAVAWLWVPALYDLPRFWVDVRFYLGWVLGLLLAPVPRRAAQPAEF